VLFRVADAVSWTGVEQVIIIINQAGQREKKKKGKRKEKRKPARVLRRTQMPFLELGVEQAREQGQERKKGEKNKKLSYGLCFSSLRLKQADLGETTRAPGAGYNFGALTLAPEASGGASPPSEGHPGGGEPRVSCGWMGMCFSTTGDVQGATKGTPELEWPSWLFPLKPEGVR